MPAPTTVDEFVDLVRKSAVLDEPRLSSYVQKLTSDPATPKELSGIAGLFVRDGLLTYFQAEQFLQGRWKRFTIGKYKVLERLGSGGMGQVFLCEHKLMRRRVAVKVLPTAKAADPSSLERFYREARAVAALDHSNIVRAYDIDQDDNLHFLVMEYVDGANLQDIIRKSGPMNVTRACHYMYWCAIGLQHAHVAGLIHRDIKPGNILVDRQGVVKILDLGLARFFNDDEDMLTKKYDESVLGTADYLAPEQAIDSHTVDGRADIYSLGATFYFLLTGNPPYAEGTVAQKLLWHQTRTPKPIREVRSEVPADVAAILQKMMAKKPEDRYQTPGQLAEALLPLTQTAIPPPPDTEMPQLSAAALGSASGQVPVSNGPRTMVTAPRTPMPTATQRPSAGPPPVPSPGRGSSQVVAVADADTQRKRPAPVIEPIPDSTPGGTPIWEAISADTANNARVDTDRKKREGTSSRKTKPEPLPPKSGKKGPKSGRKTGGNKQFPWILVLSLAAGFVVIAVAAGVYWFVIREKPKTGDNKFSSNAPQTLVVSRGASGPNQFHSISEALQVFKPNDRIVIQDDEWEESVAVSGHKNLVVAGADGKRVNWRAPAGKNVPHLLSLNNAEGARISGITFQCGGKAECAIRIAQKCSGLLLEDVELADATNASLIIHDCVCEKDRPAVIRKCRFTESAGKECKAAVLFTSAAKGAIGVSQHVQVLGCVVEGSFREGAFQFDGSANGIEIRNNRVWKAGSGVCFKKKGADTIWKVDITNNTFHTMTGSGFRIEDAGPMRRLENKIIVNQNYFQVMPVVAQIEGDVTGATFMTAEGNYRKTGTPSGAPIAVPPAVPPAMPPVAPPPVPPFLLPTQEIDVDLVPDTLLRPKFLAYDRTSPLFTAFNGKPVGAPPE
jgi:eukaryotic-like serine/threonine-protein kinase